MYNYVIFCFPVVAKTSGSRWWHHLITVVASPIILFILHGKNIALQFQWQSKDDQLKKDWKLKGSVFKTSYSDNACNADEIRRDWDALRTSPVFDMPAVMRLSVALDEQLEKISQHPSSCHTWLGCWRRTKKSTTAKLTEGQNLFIKVKGVATNIVVDV